MKKILLILFILLFISTVGAVDKSVKVTEFEKCVNLSIKVDTSYSSGKYYLEGCNETSPNNWYCECSDGYKLYMTMVDDTLDDYQFNIINNYLDFSYKDGSVQSLPKTESKSLVNLYRTSHCKSLCGDGICMETKYCLEDNSTCAEDCVIKNETNESLTQNNTSPPSTTPPEEPTPMFLIMIIIFLFVLMGVIIFALIASYYMEKKQDEFEDLKEKIKYEDLQKFVKEDENENNG